MLISLNGDTLKVDENSTIADLIHKSDYQSDVVVFVNNELILEDEFEETQIKENDDVLVLQFLGGG